MNEIKGNIFDSKNSIIHFISADLKMETSFSIFFKMMFGGLSELQTQNLGVGDCGILERNNRYILYPILKYNSWNYADFKDFEKSMNKLKEICLDKNIKEISISNFEGKIDKFEWEQVKMTIAKTFNDTNIKVAVYCL